MADQRTLEPDERKIIEYRFRTIDRSGYVRLKEASVYCKVTSCRGTWEHEVPLEVVKPFPIRFTSTPGIVWLMAGLVLFAMTFGVLSLVDREMGMMNRPTASVLVITCLFLICFAWRHHLVTCVMFPTDPNYYIVFCNRGPHADRFRINFSVPVIRVVRRQNRLPARQVERTLRRANRHNGERNLEKR